MDDTLTEILLGEMVHNFDYLRRPIKSSDRVRGETPYYGASGIVDSVEGYTHDGDFLLISEDGENLRSRAAPIAFRTSGRIWVNNHAHVVSGIEPFDTAYLQYVLAGMDISGYLTGSAQPKLSRTALDAIKIWVPSAARRRGIVEFLGALDDKIAANELAVSRSQELTDVLFRSILVEADLESVTFGSVVQIGGGGTPKTSVAEYWNGDVRWATPTDVTALRAPYLESTSRQITAKGLEACSSQLYPTGSILMTSRATIGAFAVAQVPVSVNQGFIVVNAIDPNMQWWLFHDMRARVQEFLSHANGATFLELPRGKFRELEFRVPDALVAKRFSEKVEAIHRHAAQLQRENSVLARTRDQLLPLLVSGRLSVKDTGSGSRDTF